MNEQHKEIMEEVKELKDDARGLRKEKKHLAAVKKLQKAIKKLKSISLPTDDGDEPATSWEIEVAKQLADCYGSIGGAYRDAGNLPDSFRAYDAGYVYESNPRYSYQRHPREGIINSYNLVQRLVSRILYAPEVLESAKPVQEAQLPEGLTLKEALHQSVEEINRQLKGPRQDDSWALADQALTSLLIEDEKTANEAWDKFDSKNPRNHAYEITLEVIKQLAEKDLPEKIKTSLQGAAERLERQLARLRQS